MKIRDELNVLSPIDHASLLCSSLLHVLQQHPTQPPRRAPRLVVLHRHTLQSCLCLISDCLPSHSCCCCLPSSCACVHHSCLQAISRSTIVSNPSTLSHWSHSPRLAFSGQATGYNTTVFSSSALLHPASCRRHPVQHLRLRQPWIDRLSSKRGMRVAIVASCSPGCCDGQKYPQTSRLLRSLSAKPAPDTAKEQKTRWTKLVSEMAAEAPKRGKASAMRAGAAARSDTGLKMSKRIGIGRNVSRWWHMRQWLTALSV